MTFRPSSWIFSFIGCFTLTHNGLACRVFTLAALEFLAYLFCPFALLALSSSLIHHPSIAKPYNERASNHLAPDPLGLYKILRRAQILQRVKRIRLHSC
jgi:hypothetical protein